MRIKVTGYMDTEDLPYEHVDLGHETGLSDEGFQHFQSGDFTGRTALSEVEFEAVKDDE